MKKLLSQSIKTLFLALLFGAVTVLAQWTPPSGSPSTMNTPTPLNTSSTGQIKSGAIGASGFQGNGLYLGATSLSNIPGGGSAHINGGVSIGNGITTPTSGNLSVGKSIGAGTVNMANSPAGSIGASGLVAAGGDIFTALGNIYSGAGAYLGTYLPAGTTGGVAAERFCLPGTNGSACITTWPSAGSTLPPGRFLGDMLSWNDTRAAWEVNSLIKNLNGVNRVGINLPTTGFTAAPTATLDVDGDIRSRVLTGANPVLCHDASGKIIMCVVTNGGGTLMPPGTQDQTLRHTGTSWVATSTLKNSDQQVKVTTPQPLKVEITPQAFGNFRNALDFDTNSPAASRTRISTDTNYFDLWSNLSNQRANLEVGGLHVDTMQANSSVCTSGDGWLTTCAAGGNNTPLPVGQNYNTLRHNGIDWVKNNSIKDDGHTLTVGDQTYGNQPYDAYKFSVKRGGLLVDLSNVNAGNWMGRNALTLNVDTAQNNMVSLLTNAPTFQFWSSGSNTPAKIETGDIHSAGNIDADNYIHANGSITADGDIDSLGHISSNGGYIFAKVTATNVTQVPGDVRAEHSLISDNLANNNFNPVCADSVGKLALCSVSSGTNVDSFTTPGTTTWTVPAGVNSIRAQVFGAGGGGAGGSTGSCGQFCAGGGGGGGGYVDVTLTVTPGQTYSVLVGTGGNGGAGNNVNPASPGLDGTQSKFGTSYIANGGHGAPANNISPYNQPGGGGTASAPTGTVASGNTGVAGQNQSPYQGGAGGYSGAGSSYTYGKGGKGGNGFSQAGNGINGTSGAVIITY